MIQLNEQQSKQSIEINLPPAFQKKRKFIDYWKNIIIIILIVIIIISAIIICLMKSTNNSFFQQLKQLKQQKQKKQKNSQIIQWPQKLYSEMIFDTPPENTSICQNFNFPRCKDLPWTVQNITQVDKRNMEVGNITQKSLKMGRKFFLLGLQQPTQQLLKQERDYYQQRYPDFYNYKQQLPFCVLILSFKNVANNRYLFALKTVLRQNYTNYHIVYIDDGSGDGTGYLAQKYLNENAKNPEKHKVVISNYRRISLQNNYIFAQEHCNQHDVQFFAPDGDDGLVGILTFQLYNYYYQKYDIWVSWGAAVFISTGQLWATDDVPQQSIQKGNLGYLWNYVHHPKIYYNKLWRLTDVQKFLYSDGTFYASAGDNIAMLAVAQLGRFHLKEIPQATYLYNNAHSLNQGGGKFILDKLSHMHQHKKFGAVDCMFPLENGTCLKASQYVLAWQRGQINQTKKQKIIDNNNKNFNQYPQQIHPNQQQIKSEKNKINMQKYNISNESFDLAQNYLKLGLKQPSKQLILKQKKYYQSKYNFSEIKIEFPFCVFITGYNNIQNQRYKLALNSVFRQDYKNYRLIYVDDNSIVGNSSQIASYIQKNAPSSIKHIFVQGKLKRNYTFNHYIYAKQYCNKYDLEFQIDGNDGLIGTQVFKLYNYHFQKSNIWAAWGVYLNSFSGQIKSLNPMNNQQISSNKFQSHPIVFYEKLWTMTKPRQLLNKLDWFYWTATNLASARRVFQLAGDKILFIPQLVYIKVDNHEYSQQNNVSKQEMDQVLHKIMQHKYNKLFCLINSLIEDPPMQAQETRQLRRIQLSKQCLQTRSEIQKSLNKQQ